MSGLSNADLGLRELLKGDVNVIQTIHDHSTIQSIRKYSRLEADLVSLHLPFLEDLLKAISENLRKGALKEDHLGRPEEPEAFKLCRKLLSFYNQFNIEKTSELGLMIMSRSHELWFSLNTLRRPEETSLDSWLNFKRIYLKTEVPDGLSRLQMVWDEVLKISDKNSCDCFGEDESFKRTCLFCREMAKRSKNGTFFLSDKSLGKLLGVCDMTAKRRLDELMNRKLIILVEKGTFKDHQASSYRFIDVVPVSESKRLSSSSQPIQEMESGLDNSLEEDIKMEEEEMPEQEYRPGAEEEEYEQF